MQIILKNHQTLVKIGNNKTLKLINTKLPLQRLAGSLKFTLKLLPKTFSVNRYSRVTA